MTKSTCLASMRAINNQHLEEETRFIDERLREYDIHKIEALLDLTELYKSRVYKVWTPSGEKEFKKSEREILSRLNK